MNITREDIVTVFRRAADDLEKHEKCVNAYGLAENEDPLSAFATYEEVTSAPKFCAITAMARALTLEGMLALKRYLRQVHGDLSVFGAIERSRYREVFQRWLEDHLKIPHDDQAWNTVIKWSDEHTKEEVVQAFREAAYDIESGKFKDPPTKSETW